MGYEIHLGRFLEDLETEAPISKQEWMNYLHHDDELQWEEDGAFASIQAYSDKYQKWVPVFWIDKEGHGFMRARGFFNSDVSYPKAYDIAEYLHAFIYGDEGEIYFLPGYGTIFDDEEQEQGPNLTLEDLKRYKLTYGNDYGKIMQVLKEKKRIKSIPEQAIESTQKNQRTLWLVGIIVVALVMLYIILS